MKIFWIISLTLFLWSCIDTSAVTSKEESESIKVSAFFYGNEKNKDTTIATFDTLLLTGKIYPERKNGISKYFWKAPNGNLLRDFQIETILSSPGTYQYTFTIVDYHGDTLSDYVTIHVSSPPTLDSNNWIPENKTSRLSPDSIFFSWNGHDTDGDDITYKFTLLEDSKILLDTVLSNPYFKLQNKLKELENYTWKVSTKDSQGINGESFVSEFSTGSFSKKARFSGTISIYPKEILDLVTLTLDSENESYNLKIDQGNFDSHEIGPGSYTLTAEIKEFPDYKTEFFSLTLKPGDYKSNIRINLKDSKAPSLLFIETDTLPDLSRLVLPIENHGVPLEDSLILAILDNDSLDKKISGDTLFLDIPKYNLPICRFLYLKLEDIEGNSFAQNFYLCKENSWAEKLQDTIITKNDTLSITFKESNSYNLSLKKIIWTCSENPKWKIEQTKDESEILLLAKDFSPGKYTIEANSIYQNGLELQNHFQLEITE